ncbi:uncharacterized protein LOC131269406 [Anopheles coustani]|uniref:uncharacterized protein LOC131269406 n=1 Tax=Anopheles coustani TaxID=139045 RepID=UPI00265A69EE|nr:uncharacterized protein LOC131269406 [Anopheles coustani]
MAPVFDNQEPMELDEPPPPAQRQRKTAKKKMTLRKLTALDETTAHPAIRQKQRNFGSVLRRWTISLVVVALCSVGLMKVIEQSESLQLELTKHYHQTFDRLSRASDNLCGGKKVNYAAMVRALEAHIVGQDTALREIKQWFQGEPHLPYRCMAFHGSTGVGKSLAAKEIAANFPWPDGVYFVAASEPGSGRNRYAAFKSTLFKIQRASFMRSKCTHYLLVVDHLSADVDMGVVVKMSNRLRSIGRKNHLFLRALFVFQGSGPALSVDTLRRELPEATVIAFHTLTEHDLEQCIRREAVSVGIDLETNQSLLQIVAKNINVSRHGCKPVRAKLTLHS